MIRPVCLQKLSNLKTNVESLILRLGKDEDLVKDLDRRTDEMKEVCKSVVSLVKHGIAGVETKLADSQVRV